ncbi:Ribose transport system permease protein RbsC [Stieleria maiorica]|uniref:Ribose transport system permease protein RbsC n=1 Tax=Stieleria maiorica TaxID=2795974 RepID=A0A5B9M7T9_9BACT|nr:ABC transporter permease [Stieleria maiorica]QEF96723.1 Ribose transport system permease protein RbsC [Stieleria maiorica]
MTENQARPGKFHWLTSFRHGPTLALLAIIALFAILDWQFGSGRFFSPRNARVIVNSAALIAVPALGMTMIIIAGGIDLSAGTALTLSGTALAIAFRDYTLPADQAGAATWIAAALALGLAVGVLCGLLNGLIISLTEMVPFIVTLGTMTIFLGLGQVIADESTVYPETAHLPDWLRYLCYTGSNSDHYWLGFLHIPASALIAIVLGLFVAALMHFTVFGRNVVAIGSNVSTARLCGIRVGLTTAVVYALAGVFVAVGALLYFANVKNGNPSDGTGKELEIIAAVVLGGGSLSGGRGSVLGTIIGALIIKTISSGCTMLSIPNTYTHIIIGVIIIIAVLIDGLRNGAPKWLFDRLR